MYTTVKIPEETRKSMDVLRGQIARKGLDNLPENFKRQLSANSCPFCYTQLKTNKVVYGGIKELHTCPKCGFSKPVMEIGVSVTADDVLKAIGTATLVALGIYVLGTILSESR